jgi:hypothetical protein
MAGAKPKTTAVTKNDNTITLKDIPHFYARGMKQVHGWRLARMTEFSKFHTYHGEIWAAKDDRLLVRFKFKTGLCLETYEICGMTAADLFNIVFDPASDEAAALEGNIITLRESGKSIVLSGSKGVYVPPEENFWLSWVPPCVRDAWDRWVDEIENS